MNLHRTSGSADWEVVSRKSHNFFQKLAVKTRGWITPANLISVLGLGLVFFGLLAIVYQQVWWGLGMIVIGRLLDIVDGVVADFTGTKSPLGEKFDAIIDKAGTLLTIIVLLLLGTVNWWLIVALALPQIATAILIVYKKSRGIGVHPTPAGKLSMAFVWIGIVGLLAMMASELLIIAVVTYAAIGLSVVLGIYALYQYMTGRD
jgi:phosphatidylglycerophosphate synthase